MVKHFCISAKQDNSQNQAAFEQIIDEIMKQIVELRENQVNQSRQVSDQLLLELRREIRHDFEEMKKQVLDSIAVTIQGKSAKINRPRNLVDLQYVCIDEKVTQGSP